MSPSWQSTSEDQVSLRPAIFLDRDGVINVNRADHVKSWDEFEFLPGAVDAIVELSRTSLDIFVITNQAVVNRGMVTREIVEWINLRMQRAIESCGGRITEVAYCPHRPSEACGCRKPEPGLLLSLASRHDIDLGRSIMVGDALTDVDAAMQAGCQPILVLTGRGREQLANAQAQGRGGFEVAENLLDAADIVLERMHDRVVGRV